MDLRLADIKLGIPEHGLAANACGEILHVLPVLAPVVGKLAVNLSLIASLCIIHVHVFELFIGRSYPVLNYLLTWGRCFRVQEAAADREQVDLQFPSRLKELPFNVRKNNQKPSKIDGL